MNRKFFIAGMAIVGMNAFCDYTATDNGLAQRRLGYWETVPLSEVIRQVNGSNLIDGATNSEITDYSSDEQNLFGSLDEDEVMRTHNQDHAQNNNFSVRLDSNALEELEDESLYIFDENNNFLGSLNISDEKYESRVIENSREEEARLIR